MHLNVAFLDTSGKTEGAPWSCVGVALYTRERILRMVFLGRSIMS